MRLFLGVELDDAVRTAAASAAARLRQELRHVAPRLDGRWIEAANLHITIWFIGETTDARREAIVQALIDRPLATAAFELAVGGFGAFPPSGRPRVFWLGVGQGYGALAQLYGEVGERLQPLGMVPERRSYSAHVTVARVRETGRVSRRMLGDVLARVPADCGPCRAQALTLFRSRLSPRGAAYEPLLRVPLS